MTITSIERCKQDIVFGSRDHVIAKIKVNASPGATLGVAPAAPLEVPWGTNLGVP